MYSLPRLSRLLPMMAIALLLALAPANVQAQVDLNSASFNELAAVDGISASMAQKIIAARPLRTKRDLMDQLGMQPNVYSRVSDQVIARQGTGSGSGSGSGTGSGSGSSSSNTGTGGGRQTGTGGSTDFGRPNTGGTGSDTGGFNTGTGSGRPTNTGGTGGSTQNNTGSGTGNNNPTSTGNGQQTNTGGGTTSGTGDGNVYREHYSTGTSSLHSGNYQNSIDELLAAQQMADQYGNRQESAAIRAELASAYLWRGIELYKDAAWGADYDNAIQYLRAADIQISSDDYWVSAMGGQSQAMRKLNLKNYYLGMSYFEKGAYFDWVDNDGAAKMFLSMVTKSKEQWNYFSDPKILMEQKVLYADAKYTLAQLMEKSRDSQFAAQNYMEAYKTYQELRATGMGEAVYYFGEGDRGTSYNQLFFSSRRKKRQSMEEKMQTMESSLVSLASQANNSSDYGTARDIAGFVFKNSSSHETKASALDVTIGSYEKSNDFQRAIQLRQQYRNDFGYHKMTIGMANDYRQIGDNGQAANLYKEVINASGADRQYKTQAADGLAEMTLPDIDAKISGGNFPAAVSSIKSFLDSYPTSRKNDFTRRVGDIVDKYVASGDTASALKLIDDFVKSYSSGNDSLLESKKVGILEKSGDFGAFKAAVLAFDAKYSRSDSATANAQLVRLVQLWEQQSNKDDTAIQGLVDQLASRGNSFGTSRHQAAAQAEISRIRGLGNKAQIRAGLLHMAMFPDARYSTAKQVIDSARDLYLAQYASPWYYDAKSRAAGSPASAKGVFGGVKDDKAQLKHDLNADVWKQVEDRELNTYARYDANELDALFGPSTPAQTAYKALTSRIDAELAAFAAWKDASIFKSGGFKKTYNALHDSKPGIAELQADFLAKAFAARSGGTGNGGTRKETAPSFDGANR